jgi:hypothetical protein
MNSGASTARLSVFLKAGVYNERTSAIAEENLTLHLLITSPVIKECARPFINGRFTNHSTMKMLVIDGGPPAWIANPQPFIRITEPAEAIVPNIVLSYRLP